MARDRTPSEQPEETAERRYAVDERLVMPESRFEVIDGEVVYVSPADPPHATQHSKLSALLEAYVAEGYVAASDLLTRTSEKGDMAPDGSIYPGAPDPETGGRRLEEMAFEVASSESLTACGRKAAALVSRGVRRVFALDVERVRALEWSRDKGAWEVLAPDGVIADRVFVLSLPVADLVGAARADDAVARALLAKKNRVLTDALDGARVEGRVEAKAESVLAVLAVRGIAPDDALRERIRKTRDLALLDRWLQRAATCTSAADLLDA